jgi:pimeloyl-ACP methyl ester carboxylesterase
MAYSLWLPKRSAPRAGVLILHGAGSCKESHHDFARAAQAAGLAALAFDQRGHGASEGAMGGDVLEDIGHMAEVLRSHLGPGRRAVALRGSSMGGCLALLAAGGADAAAVVAICPASPTGMRRRLAGGDVPFRADTPALDALLARVDLSEVIASLQAPLLLLHAEGDEQVPVQHSRELAQHMRSPLSRLITLPGGHHRSIQHDGELQAVSLRFIEKALAAEQA